MDYRIIREKKFLCSLMLSFLVGFLICLSQGFRFVSYTNDDYMISLLLSKGEAHTLYINYLFSNFLVFLQSVFNGINCFVLVQHILCFISIVILSYIILCNNNSIFGIIISVIFSSLVFLSSILMVQYSQTPVVICVAGVGLMTYAFLRERRRGVRIFQYIIAAIMIVISSLFRIASFEVCLLFSILFLFCVFLRYFFETVDVTNVWKSLFQTIKKFLPLIICFFISCIFAFGANFVSEIILKSDEHYVELSSYNSARMQVDDYETLPYNGNELFYQSNGINSKEELSLYHYDKETYGKDVLKNIADMSSKTLLNGESKVLYSFKKTVYRFIRTIKDIYGNIIKWKEMLGLRINDKVFAFIVLGICTCIIIAVFLLAFLYSKKRQKTINSKRIVFLMLFLLLWLVFFMVVKIRTISLLFIPLCGTVFFLLINSKKYYAECILFSVIPMALYLYQSNFRISYRVSYTFLIPSIFYLLFLVNVKLEKTKNNKKAKYKFIEQMVFCIILTISFSIASIFSYLDFYPKNSMNYELKLREYIDNHPDTVFMNWITINSLIDEGYYNALYVPNVPDNEVMIGWYMYSNYFENHLKETRTENLLLDIIDQNKRIILVENEIMTLEEQEKQYEVFYNNHYFNGEKRVDLETEIIYEYGLQSNNPERNIKRAGVYKVNSIR